MGHHYGPMKEQTAKATLDGGPQQLFSVPVSYAASKRDQSYLSPRDYDVGSQPDADAPLNRDPSQIGAPHHHGLGSMKASVGVVLNASIGNEGLEPKTPKFIVGKNKVPDAVTQRVVAALNL